MNWDFHSFLPAVGWPAVPAPAEADGLALLFQIEQSQWLSPDRIVAHQFAQLHPLLAHAYGTVPFYRARLAAAGFSPHRPVTPEVFSRIAPLRRAELQQEGLSLRSEAPPAAHGAVVLCRTSGSTGQPVTAAASQLSATIWKVLTLRDHLWQRRDLGGRLAVIRNMEAAAAPAGIVHDNWGPATQRLCATGRSAVLHVATDPALQLEWLRRFDPDYLLTYPSNLRALVLHAEAERIKLPRLREVRTIGEIVPPDLRQLCRDAWGVPLTDAYSANETGYLALQCPDHEHYHVQSEAAFVEVLDAEGKPCQPGETGRVVLTLLHNFAMPLIRYEIGDFAEVGGSCPCGRGLPVLKRILGRVRNLVTLPDGSRHWPTFKGDTWEHIRPVRQIQLIQIDRQTIEARLVCDRRLDDGEEADFAATLGRTFGYPFAVVFSYVDRLERSVGGKFEDFMSRVG